MKYTLALAAFLLATPTHATDIAEIGSFHVGGRVVTLDGLPKKEIVFSPGAPPLTVDPNGEFAVEQMYVQYVKQTAPKARYPLLLWHGGGLTGVTWETTPDGRPGWQDFFIRAGHDVYVSDAVERGRASWARYPEVFKTEPMFRTQKEAWELFRLGPTYDPDPARRTPFPGTQFPTDHLAQFMKQGVPRWVTDDAATQAAYDALVQRICPCVVLTHSQGGNFGFTAALHAPDKIRALISIEPSGAPDPAKTEITALKGVPHLVVYGDYLETSPFWQRILTNTTRYQSALATQGGTADLLSLPTTGIHGNTHMLMMDHNSDEIATLVQAWIERQGFMK